jgi:hypothetical protein
MGIFDAVKNNILKNLLKKSGNEIIYRARMEMHAFQKRLVGSLVAASFLMLSFLFLSLAAVYFFIEYMHLTKTLSFLIIAIIILIIGIFIKLLRR